MSHYTLEQRFMLSVEINRLRNAGELERADALQAMLEEEVKAARRSERRSALSSIYGHLLLLIFVVSTLSLLLSIWIYPDILRGVATGGFSILVAQIVFELVVAWSRSIWEEIRTLMPEKSRAKSPGTGGDA